MQILLTRQRNLPYCQQYNGHLR